MGTTAILRRLHFESCTLFFFPLAWPMSHRLGSYNCVSSENLSMKGHVQPSGRVGSMYSLATVRTLFSALRSELCSMGPELNYIRIPSFRSLLGAPFGDPDLDPKVGSAISTTGTPIFARLLFLAF